MTYPKGFIISKKINPLGLINYFYYHQQLKFFGKTVLIIK